MVLPTDPPARTLKQRCLAVTCLVVDVDGVLTAGEISYAAAGGATVGESKSFHVRDGSGLKLWANLGLRWAVLTGRSSSVVTTRAGELGASRVIQGASDKRQAFEALAEEWRVEPAAVCYVGDDEPDVPVMSLVGLAVAVADACATARRVAHYQTVALGGRGAVREVIERILRCQGKMPELLG